MFGVKIVHYFGSGIFQNFEGPQNVVTSTPRPSAPSFPQDVFHRLLCSVAVGDDQPRAGHGRTSVAAPEAMKQDNKGCVGSQSQFVTPKISAHKQPHGNTLLRALVSLLVGASHRIIQRTLCMWRTDRSAKCLTQSTGAPRVFISWGCSMETTTVRFRLFSDVRLVDVQLVVARTEQCQPTTASNFCYFSRPNFSIRKITIFFAHVLVVASNPCEDVLHSRSLKLLHHHHLHTPTTGRVIK